MTGVNYLAVVVAAVAGFIFSTIYYIAFARARTAAQSGGGATGRSRPPAWKMALEEEGW